ncbi:hypothetical protein SLS57_011566 [Botryosphaeria dothidea]
MDLLRLYVGQSSLSIVSDLLVILLPIPAFQQLKISKKEKYVLIGIFALGSFGCVTTIVRLYYVLRNSDDRDVTWNNIDPMTWSASEVFVGITCASLPALKRFVQKLFPRLLQGSSYPSATRPSGNGPDLPYTNHGSNAGRKPIPLGAVRTLSKNSDVVTVARSVSKDKEFLSKSMMWQFADALDAMMMTFQFHMRV